MSDTEDAFVDTALFEDPEDYYPPTPPPTTQTYTTGSGDVITLHLVGHSPLEAHHLWNGSRVVSQLFESEPSLVKDRTVLELGAGAGLPSIVAATLGARRVVLTDYPDPDLVETMWRNVRGCELIPRSTKAPQMNGANGANGVKETTNGVEEGEDEDEGLNIVVDGYVWGADPTKLLAHLEGTYQENEVPAQKGFDVLILADLLFRHSEHGNMLKTIEQTLKRTRDSQALVVFTSYRPWLQHKDLAFFDLARERGFVVEKVLEKKMDRPLFEEDPGDEEVLKTVTGWVLSWPLEALQ